MDFDSSSFRSQSSSEQSEENDNNYSYDSLSWSESLFLSNTGMKLQCFDLNFFQRFEPYLEEKRHIKGPKDVLSYIDEAVMILVYLRQGQSYSEIGRIYNLSARRIRRIIKDVFEFVDILNGYIKCIN